MTQHEWMELISDSGITPPKNQLLRHHNIVTVQSKSGWTKADVDKAITDAENGIRYER